MFVDSHMYLELPDCSNSCVKEVLKENEAKWPFELITKFQSNSESYNSNQKNDAVIMFCGPFTNFL